MTRAHDPDTDHLLRLAGQGEEEARRRLLERHRDRLRRMVAVRLDPRLASRLDPSDLIQEALADAAAKLDAYLRDRPLPFYPWLHRLTAERIAQAHRRHVTAQARGVGREQPGGLPMPDESAALLADRLAARGSTPSQHLIREEQRRRVREALDRLAPGDREILVMRYLEGIAFGEIAAILGITEGAAKVRHFRALDRIRKMIDRDDEGTGR